MSFLPVSPTLQHFLPQTFPQSHKSFYDNTACWICILLPQLLHLPTENLVWCEAKTITLFIVSLFQVDFVLISFEKYIPKSVNPIEFIKYILLIMPIRSIWETNINANICISKLCTKFCIGKISFQNKYSFSETQKKKFLSEAHTTYYQCFWSCLSYTSFLNKKKRFVAELSDNWIATHIICVQ